MDQHQQERQAALEAFLASLEQLENAMEQPLEAAAVLPVPDRAAIEQEPIASPELDVLALEAAAADIEQFMQAQKAEEQEEQTGTDR